MQSSGSRWWRPGRRIAGQKGAVAIAGDVVALQQGGRREALAFATELAAEREAEIAAVQRHQRAAEIEVETLAGALRLARLVVDGDAVDQRLALRRGRPKGLTVPLRTAASKASNST
jgi:hypothetical protein